MNFFISDTHFGHKNILKFERRQFNTIEEHDKFVVDSINRIVKLTDTLYILGDIGNPELVKEIKCRVIMYEGNHDRRPRKEYLAYFAEVYDKPIYISDRIVLSHYPIPVSPGILNVHGHLHGSYLDSRNHLNVSAAMCDFTPVSENKLFGIVGSLPKDNTKFLEEWFADLYVFPEHELRKDIVTDEFGRIKVEESRNLRETIFKDEKGFALDVFKDGE